MQLSAERRLGRGLFIGGLSVAGLFYLLATAAVTERWLFRVELALAERLALLQGLSGGGDWSLLILGSQAFAICAGVLLIGYIARDAWLRRRSHFGRLYGAIAFTLLAAALAGLIVHELSEEIPRSSPWRILQGAALDLADRRDADFITFHRRSYLVDGVVFFWGSVTLMLLTRFPFAAICSLGLLMLHGFAKLALGLDWLTTSMLSLASSCVVSGAVLAWGGRPREWFERKSEVVALALLWSHFFPRKKGKLRPILANPDAARAWERRMRNEEIRKEAEWLDVLEREVLPIVGHDASGYRLTAISPNEPEGQSVSPYVRFLIFESGRTYVIKMAHKRGMFWWKRPGRIQKYVQSLRNAAALESMGVPVPRTHWAEERVERLGLDRRFLAVEQFINGRALDCNDTGQAALAGRVVAGLHGHVGSNWGELSVNRKRRRPYIAVNARPTMILYLRKMASRFRFQLDDERLELIWARLEELLVEIPPDHSVFRLTHGDLTRHNLLVSEDGNATLIDFVDARFDLAANELLKLAVVIGRINAASRATFWRSYFSCQTGMSWAEFLAQSKWALASLGIREIAQGRVLLGRGLGKEERKEVVLSRVEELLHADVNWGTRPEETDWDSVAELFSQIGSTPANGSPPIVSMAS